MKKSSVVCVCTAGRNVGKLSRPAGRMGAHSFWPICCSGVRSLKDFFLDFLTSRIFFSRYFRLFNCDKCSAQKGRRESAEPASAPDFPACISRTLARLVPKQLVLKQQVTNYFLMQCSFQRLQYSTTRHLSVVCIHSDMYSICTYSTDLWCDAST